jgi:hypothetical protein
MLLNEISKVRGSGQADLVACLLHAQAQGHTWLDVTS